MKRIIALLAVPALALMVSTAHAQDQQKVPATAANTQQKAQFVTNLVTNSAAVRAIEASGDTAAKDSLTKARGLIEQAKKASAAGDQVGADKKLNEALELVMTTTRRISEGSVKEGRAKQLYEQRVASVNTLLDAFDRVAKEKSSAAATQRKPAVQQLLAEADAMAKRGDHVKALPLVDRAYSMVSAEVASLREGDKLVKELAFATPEDEYVYEVDRNDSHFFLLKLTLSEKEPHQMVLTQVDKLRGEAQQLRGEAEDLAKKKGHTQAIKTLGDSTDRLIKALRLAGAYIPG